MDLIPTNRPQELRVVLRTRQHAALYDPASQSLSLESRHPISSALSRRQPSSLIRSNGIDSSSQDESNPTPTSQPQPFCSTCLRPFPWGSVSSNDDDQEDSTTSTHPHYFRLLAEATSLPGSQVPSRTATPTPGSGSRSRRHETSSDSENGSERLDEGVGVEGYYERFFVEEKKLGRGARGTVYLCQHVLNGNNLGRYAIKKIPVGSSSKNLVKSLNEVHILKSLAHPNIIHYQHVWLEHCSFSLFGPRVPTLHVLMGYANGGSLEDWLVSRSGNNRNQSPRNSHTSFNSKVTSTSPLNPSSNSGSSSPLPDRSQAEKLKAAFRKRRDQPSSLTSESNGTVHFLREEEITSLLQDITSGLGFLHDRGVLHLDIKPANVLLEWEDDSMLPRALLSDFGSSTFQHENWTSRKRSGNTGTMEYMPPETFHEDPKSGKLEELSSKADIWSLGMILHLLIFLRLPYRQVEDLDQLRIEMLNYRGFFDLNLDLNSPGASRLLLEILKRTLSLESVKRPSCQEILKAIQIGSFTSHPQAQNRQRQHVERRDHLSNPQTSMPDHLLLSRRRSVNNQVEFDHSLDSEARIEQLGTPIHSGIATPIETSVNSDSHHRSPTINLNHNHMRRLSHKSRLSITARTSRTEVIKRVIWRNGRKVLWAVVGLNGGQSGIHRKVVLVGMALIEYIAFDSKCGSLGNPIPLLKYSILILTLILLSICSDPTLVRNLSTTIRLTPLIFFLLILFFSRIVSNHIICIPIGLTVTSNFQSLL